MNRASLKADLVAAVIVGSLAVLLTMITKDERSPLYDYFFEHPGLRDVWVSLNFPVLMVAMVTGLASRPFVLLLIFLQWFYLSLIMGLLINVIRYRNAPTRLDL
jgi:hypothetical protein